MGRDHNSSTGHRAPIFMCSPIFERISDLISAFMGSFILNYLVVFVIIEKKHKKNGKIYVVNNLFIFVLLL